jgi:hypothetical protein
LVTIPAVFPFIGPPPIPPITVTGTSAPGATTTGGTQQTITVTGGTAPGATAR